MVEKDPLFEFIYCMCINLLFLRSFIMTPLNQFQWHFYNDYTDLITFIFGDLKQIFEYTIIYIIRALYGSHIR